MLKKIIHKIISKCISSLEKINGRVRTHKKNPDSKITKEGFFFVRLFENRKIFAPSVDCLNLYKPIFEKETYRFNSKRENPLIIDCGANVGMAIIYWKIKYPNARIIAFEPSIKVFEALKRNVEEFNLKDVQIVNAALSDSVGEKEFTVNEGVSGSLVLEKDLGKVYLVKTVLLDSYLTEKVDFLKVDIEGEEVRIFPQIVKHLSNIQNLFIEYHSFVDRPQILSVFLEQLEKNGFRYYIEGEYRHTAPLYNDHVNLKQDLQVGIWAKKLDA